MKFNQELFSKQLQLLISESGKSQAAVARESGVPPTALNYYILCKRKPNIYDLFALADYFNCSLDYLTGRSDY